VQLVIQVWVQRVDYSAVRSDLLEQIKLAFEQL
jgi:hypothetical protein